MEYELVWQYVDEPAPAIESEPYIHFWFMLRFPDVPAGNGHTANFNFNVFQKPDTNKTGISVVRRGFLTCIPYSKSQVQEFVEAAVAAAAEMPRDEALALLNTQFIHHDLDFSAEFVNDLLGADELLELIERAFDRVKRDEGITLHQAVVIDDYGSEEEFLAAGELDTELRWQEVPDDDISMNTSIFSFLDAKGFRYYLPAAMSWSIRNYEHDEYNCGFFAYLAVLPTVAPRDVGRGLGNAFDLDGFIKEHLLTPPQVNAIYRFICFMAITADLRMDEDYYAATLKWRKASLSH